MEGGEKTISMEFYDLALPHLLRILAKAADITILQDPQLNDAKVTIIAPKPNFTLDQAFEILASILQSHNPPFTLVKAGPSLYKTEQVPNAMRDGTLPVNVGNDKDAVPMSAAMVTQIIPLKNLSAQEVAQQVNGMLSQGSMAMPISTNMLVITDTMANVNKALQVIDYLEGQLSDGIQAVHVRYRTAEDMASMVQSLVLGRGQGGGGGATLQGPWERRVVGQGTPSGPARPTPSNPSVNTMGGEFVFADPGTNTLFVQATPMHYQQIQDLVELMDKPVDLRDSVFIYPVQNLLAADLANLVAPSVGARRCR